MIDFGAATRSILAHLSRAAGEAVPGEGASADGTAPDDGAPDAPRPTGVVRSVSSARLPAGGTSGTAVPGDGGLPRVLPAASPTTPAPPPAAGALPAVLPDGTPVQPLNSPPAPAAASPSVLPDGTPVAPADLGATLSGGLTRSAPPSLPAGSSVGVTAPVADSPGVWQRFMALLARVLGVRTAPEPPPPPAPAQVAATIARAAVPELSPPSIEAAALGTRAPRALVRPTIATVAFAARARQAWQRAAQADTPAAREHHVAEGVAWTERASRAARALQRALPPATENDRALRALLRTGLGALQESDPTPAIALDALRHIESSVRALAARYGIPLADPLGPSGRSDVPGFMARLERPGTRKTLLAVLVFALPVVAFGLIYLAVAG